MFFYLSHQPIVVVFDVLDSYEAMSAHKGHSAPQKSGAPLSTQGDSCALCLEQGEERLELLRCRHKLHDSCMQAWFEQPIAENRCPSCMRQHSVPSTSKHDVPSSLQPSVSPTSQHSVPLPSQPHSVTGVVHRAGSPTPEPEMPPLVAVTPEEEEAAFQCALRAVRISRISRAQHSQTTTNTAGTPDKDDFRRALREVRIAVLTQRQQQQGGHFLNPKDAMD